MQKDIEEKVFSKNYLKISDLIYVCIYFYFGSFELKISLCRGVYT